MELTTEKVTRAFEAFMDFGTEKAVATAVADGIEEQTARALVAGFDFGMDGNAEAYRAGYESSHDGKQSKSEELEKLRAVISTDAWGKVSGLISFKLKRARILLEETRHFAETAGADAVAVDAFISGYMQR